MWKSENVVDCSGIQVPVLRDSPGLPICFIGERDYYSRHVLKKFDLDSDNCQQNDNRNMDSAGHSERV